MVYVHRSLQCRNSTKCERGCLTRWIWLLRTCMSVLGLNIRFTSKYYITVGRVGAHPLFPRTMLFHRQLCSSNSHWCACLISRYQSITRPYLFCEKQVFPFPKRSLGFKTVTSMRVPEEPVCIDLFRQNPVFTSLHLKSPVHVHRGHRLRGRTGCCRKDTSRVRICKRLWSPGIDSEESISPAYVAWRASTTNRFSYL